MLQDSQIDPDLWLLDAHCDTEYMRVFLEGNNLPEELKGVDPDAFFRATPSRIKEGRVGCQFMNVGDINLLTSSAIIDRLYCQAENGISVCRDAGEVRRAIRNGNRAVVPACESGFLFMERLDLLRNWHRLGVRVVTLSHGEGQDGLNWFAETAIARDDQIKAGSSSALQIMPSADGYLDRKSREELRKKETGLTGFGKTAVAEMIRLGIVCDLSHASDATFWEVLGLREAAGTGKVCCTHSNCAALCSHARNLTDEMMEALAGHGGVMGLCFFGEFIDEKSPSLERYVDHVVHALDIMGPDHVGIGTDYDGVPPDAFMAVPHPGRMGDLWTALSDAGIQKATLRKIAHENFLGLL